MPLLMLRHLAIVDNDGGGITGDKVNDDGDSPTGNNIDDDGEGAMYDNINDSCRRDGRQSRRRL